MTLRNAWMGRKKKRIGFCRVRGREKWGMGFTKRERMNDLEKRWRDCKSIVKEIRVISKKMMR